MRISDWSSDVCSSDLAIVVEQHRIAEAALLEAYEVARHQRLQRRCGTATAHLELAHVADVEEPRGLTRPQVLGHDAFVLDGHRVARSEERRVGKECVSTCRYRWSPYN